ncbi:MAG: BlaI/MecI/CopY family transcriptional regulator [Pseudomonadota bacterium]
MKYKRPTEAELELLQVLWDHGPCTVREAHNHLRSERGYTTLLKLFQIMFQKDLVSRESVGNSHRYSARITERENQSGIVDHLVDRVFRQSAHSLVMQALDRHRASPEELREIRAMLDSLETGDENA